MNCCQKTVTHMIKHWLGWNRGRVVSATDEDGNIWVAFECSECGKISGRHIARFKDDLLR